MAKTDPSPTGNVCVSGTGGEAARIWPLRSNARRLRLPGAHA